ncbi:MAG: S9 family peptidase, partial [Acidobacteria bacterium]|nr:S9 family peptidase [Acidobacteriota bacterium]
MKKHISLMVLSLSLGLSLLFAADGKKSLTFEDYPRWNRIVSVGISYDGSWMSYGYRPNDGDETLHFKSLNDDRVHKIECASNPAISGDSAWAGYVVSLPKAEQERLRKARRPVTQKVEILNLKTGKKTTIDNASAFRFSGDSRFAAVKKEKASREAKHDGTDLILIHLETGLLQSIGNAGLFEFNKPGGFLAYTVDAADKAGNGIYLLNAVTGVLKALDTGEADYAQLSWDKEGTALAVLKGAKKKDATQKDNVLLAFTGVGRAEIGRVEYHPAQDAQFPKDMVLSEFGQLTWSQDDSRIFCGIKEQEKEPEKDTEKKDQPVPNVDVWHWKDERVQSIQMVRANQDRRATYGSVFLLEGGRFVRLADEEMPTVSPTEDGRWGIGRLDKPYRLETSWGGSRADYYLVDTATGERKLIDRGLTRTYGASPDSRWFLYLKDKEVWVYEIATGSARSISKGTGKSFVNEEDDHPYEKPLHGVAGWTKDGTAVILNHTFDLWSLPLKSGKATNITGGVGEREHIVFRYVDLEPEEEGGPPPFPPPDGEQGGEQLQRFGRRGGGTQRPIDTSQPLLLSAYGEWTKKSGYYRLPPGREPQKLLFEDRGIGRPSKAKNAERVVFTMQTFVEFPDYYVSGVDFAAPVRITDANPQQSDFAWGRSTLLEYTNSRGVRLQATLTLPGGYEQGKRYPMLVYFYEKMSQNHHQYSMPTYDDRPHFSLYASDGYLVLRPDVVYVTGRPGDSAVDCVTSAVKKAIELGYADPARIGVQGHSWGGYQTSFLVTQTDMFACVVTGAPPTDLV